MTIPIKGTRTDPYLHKSDTPIYMDHCVVWKGEEYRIYLDGNEHRDFLELPAKLELKPNEAPRHILEGFVYGKRVFLPLQTRGLGFDARCRELARQMLAIDAKQRRERAQARKIPMELEGEVVAMKGTHSLRAIAKWVEGKTGTECSHSSVGRLLRRKAQEARLATLDAELKDDFYKSRADFNQAADLMMDLQLDLNERLDDGEATPELVSLLRASQRTATLLERRLNTATRHLVRGPASAAPPEVPPTDTRVEPTTTDASVESSPAQPRSDASALAVALALGWMTLTGQPALAAPNPADVISPSYGVVRGIGAVIANPREVSSDVPDRMREVRHNPERERRAASAGTSRATRAPTQHNVRGTPAGAARLTPPNRVSTRRDGRSSLLSRNAAA